MAVMEGGKRRAGWLALAFGFAMAVPAGAAAEAGQFVVVVSSDARWTPGQIVPAGTVFEVPAGGRLTLIGADGKAMRIRGPYNGAPTAAAAPAGGGQVVERLAALVARERSDSSALGATRTIDLGLDAARDPLAIDVTRPGTQCVAAGKPIPLWRAASARAANGTIRRIGAEGQGAVRWQAGEHIVAWPQDVTAQAGARYVVRLQDRPQPTEIELKVVPAELPSVGYKALWMNDNGCAEQARLLLQTED